MRSPDWLVIEPEAEMEADYPFCAKGLKFQTIAVSDMSLGRHATDRTRCGSGGAAGFGY
jgi:hypothetical protein